MKWRPHRRSKHLTTNSHRVPIPPQDLNVTLNVAPNGVDVVRQPSFGNKQQTGVHRVSHIFVFVNGDVSSETAHDHVMLRYRLRLFAELPVEQSMIATQVPELFRRQSLFSKGSLHELESEVLETLHTHFDRTEVHLQVELCLCLAVKNYVWEFVLWVEEGIS